VNRRSWNALFLFVVLSLILPSPGRAEEAKDANIKAIEESIQMIRGDITARRESAVSTLIRLEGEQASAFRLLKKQYDDEVKSLDQERASVAREYAQVYRNLNPEQAGDLAGRTLSLEEKRSTLRRKYYDLMAKQVSPVAAVQFLQLQRRFDSMLDVKAATVIPIAGY
jgi:hypothetical protein